MSSLLRGSQFSLDLACGALEVVACVQNCIPTEGVPGGV